MEYYPLRDGIFSREPGNCNIYFMSTINNKEDFCNITVIQPATGIILNKNEIVLEKGENISLMAIVSPEDATDSSVAWTSTNPDIATVENGIVTAVNGGICKIIASTHNGITSECAVTVTPILVESIVLDPNVINSEEGDSIQLVATILPDYATDKSIKWTSDDSLVAEVNQQGMVKIVAPGLTTIRAIATDGSMVEGICEVTGIACIDEILQSEGIWDLFTSSGILIKKQATKSDLEKLPMGLYILFNGKRSVKFIN